MPKRSRLLLQVIGLVEKETIVGAWATSSDGSEMLVVWRRPDLVVAKPPPAEAPGFFAKSASLTRLGFLSAS
jgi:hypothetical protein